MPHTGTRWHRNIPPASKYPVIFADRNTHVAQVLSRGLTPEEIEANANLIAAGPAMLDALREAAEALDNYADADQPAGADRPIPNAAMSALTIVNHAIALATRGTKG